MEARELYEQEIMAKVRLLPKEQLAKVISMLDNLQTEHQNNDGSVDKKKYSPAIEKLWGLLADKPLSSDEFAKRKAEEKALDR